MSRIKLIRHNYWRSVDHLQNTKSNQSESCLSFVYLFIYYCQRCSDEVALASDIMWVRGRRGGGDGCGGAEKWAKPRSCAEQIHNAHDNAK